MANVELYTYNVGQGLFNLVMGHDEWEKPFCGIFDCGTIAENPAYSVDDAKKSAVNTTIIKDAREKIENAQKKPGDAGCIDLIVISHQDEDHWGKLLKFIEEMYVKLPRTEQICKQGKFYGEYKEKETAYIQWNGWLCSFGFTFHDCFSRELELTDRIDGSQFILNTLHMKQDRYDTLGINVCETHKVDVIEQRDGLYKLEYNMIQYGDSQEPHKEKAEQYYSNRIVGRDIPLVLSSLINKNSSPNSDRDALLRWIEEKTKDEECFRMWKAMQTHTTNIPDDGKPRITQVILGGGIESFQYRNLYEKLKIYQKAGLIMSISKEMNTCRGYTGNFSDTEYYVRDELQSENLKKKDGNYSLTSDLAVQRNASSVATWFEFGDPLDYTVGMLFPGDLTVHMFKKLAEVIRKWNISVDLTILIAPHHGSEDTNFSFPAQSHTIENDPDQPIRTLLGSISEKKEKEQKVKIPLRVFISAFESKFGHPAKAFVEVVSQYCASLPDSHHICWGDKDKNKVFEDTHSEIYCTEAPFYNPETKKEDVPMYLYFKWPPAPTLVTASDISVKQPLTAAKEIKPRIPSKKLFI